MSRSLSKRGREVREIQDLRKKQTNINIAYLYLQMTLVVSKKLWRGVRLRN